MRPSSCCGCGTRRQRSTTVWRPSGGSRWCRARREALEERGLPVVGLHSGAGHDAGVLAAAGVPTAMLFVRSLNGGVSHSPQEESSEKDVGLAVDVLTAAL